MGTHRFSTFNRSLVSAFVCIFAGVLHLAATSAAQSPLECSEQLVYPNLPHNEPVHSLGLSSGAHKGHFFSPKGTDIYAHGFELTQLSINTTYTVIVWDHDDLEVLASHTVLYNDPNGVALQFQRPIRLAAGKRYIVSATVKDSNAVSRVTATATASPYIDYTGAVDCTNCDAGDLSQAVPMSLPYFHSFINLCFDLAHPIDAPQLLQAYRRCSPEATCFVGEGFCSADDGCAGRSVCGLDNCLAVEGENCCGVCDDYSSPFFTPSQNCCSEDVPCAEGYGECTTDATCDAGLHCGQFNCQHYDERVSSSWNCCAECTRFFPCYEGRQCHFFTDCVGDLVCEVGACRGLVLDGEEPNGCCAPGPVGFNITRVVALNFNSIFTESNPEPIDGVTLAECAELCTLDYDCEFAYHSRSVVGDREQSCSLYELAIPSEIPQVDPNTDVNLLTNLLPKTLAPIAPIATETEPNIGAGAAGGPAIVADPNAVLLSDNLIAASILGGMVLCCILVYCSSRYVQKRAANADGGVGKDTQQALLLAPPENIRIFFVGLALVDIVTDILFTVERFGLSSSDKYAYLALSFLVLPFMFNMFIMIRTMSLEFANLEMREWFSRNSILGTASFILSCSNIEVLSLLFSKIFMSRIEGDRFYAPFTVQTQKNIYFYGLVNNFLEDVPQLAIQLWVLTSDELDGLSTVLFFALATSALTLVFGVFRRLCFVLAIRSEKRSSSGKPKRRLSFRNATKPAYQQPSKQDGPATFQIHHEGKLINITMSTAAGTQGGANGGVEPSLSTNATRPRTVFSAQTVPDRNTGGRMTAPSSPRNRPRTVFSPADSKSNLTDHASTVSVTSRPSLSVTPVGPATASVSRNSARRPSGAPPLPPSRNTSARSLVSPAVSPGGNYSRRLSNSTPLPPRHDRSRRPSASPPLPPLHDRSRRPSISPPVPPTASPSARSSTAFTFAVDHAMSKQRRSRSRPSGGEKDFREEDADMDRFKPSPRFR